MTVKIWILGRSIDDRYYVICRSKVLPRFMKLCEKRKSSVEHGKLTAKPIQKTPTCLYDEEE